MTQTQILDYMREQNRPLTTFEISDALGYPIVAVRKALRSLLRWGDVEVVGEVEGIKNHRKLWAVVE